MAKRFCLQFIHTFLFLMCYNSLKLNLKNDVVIVRRAIIMNENKNEINKNNTTEESFENQSPK